MSDILAGDVQTERLKKSRKTSSVCSLGQELRFNFSTLMSEFKGLRYVVILN